jgi:hypothetical protein
MNLDRTTRIVGVGALCVMLVGILAMGISEVHSFDVFWQLVSGKYMSQTHSFIRTDTFTLMKDVPRPEHTWLHSLILYFSYLMGGYAAISILKGLLVVCTLVFLIISARVREASYASIALLVPIFILTRGAWLERPQLWTFLLFALFVWLLEIFRRDKSWKILWLLPAGLFWINVHGGSVLALAILAAYFVGDLGEHLLLKRRFPEKGFWKILIPIVTIPIFGAVATPYPSHWFTTLFYAHKHWSGNGGFQHGLDADNLPGATLLFLCDGGGCHHHAAWMASFALSRRLSHGRVGHNGDEVGPAYCFFLHGNRCHLSGLSGRGC